jgi:tetratricopeptide (TPR) repeat protein
LINAATIALLEGDRAEAQRLAGQVLAMLNSGEHEPETAYWLGATRAEAYLLLGETEKADAILGEAIAVAPRAWEDHASTLRHFRLILEMLGQPAEWLEKHRPPPGLHFSGIIQVAPGQAGSVAKIGEEIEAISPGFAVGALAAGADIMTAELLLERGVDLHIMLPATVPAFRRDSVSPFGSEWEGRFDEVLAAAASVEALDLLDAVSQAGIFLGDQMAMGLTLGQARQLECGAVALRVGEGDRARGSALDAAWQQRGLPIRRVEVVRHEAAGAPLPAFAREAVIALPGRCSPDVMKNLGAQVQAFGGAMMARFEHPAAAARAALAVAPDCDYPLGIAYDAFDPDRPESGRFETAIRIAGAGHAGQVLVSRSLGLALALEAPELRCESLGYIASAHGDIAFSLLTQR